MNKLIVIWVLGIFLVGFVYAVDINYSNPTKINGDKIEWKQPQPDYKEKTQITKNEWNKIFEDYRNGNISKSDAVKILKGVKL